MRIHHVTVPAHDPDRVARVLAEIFGARVAPLPHPEGARLVFAGDPDGTAIEVWPAGARARIGARDFHASDAPLPDDWPHHAYISGDVVDPERVVAIFAREGWPLERVHNGPPGGGFSLLRGWLEGHATMEIVGPQMRAQYERFLHEPRGAQV